MCKSNICTFKKLSAGKYVLFSGTMQSLLNVFNSQSAEQKQIHNPDTKFVLTGQLSNNKEN